MNLFTRYILGIEISKIKKIDKLKVCHKCHQSPFVPAIVGNDLYLICDKCGFYEKYEGTIQDYIHLMNKYSDVKLPVGYPFDKESYNDMITPTLFSWS